VKEQVITVTMAARMFADCVNRVRYQGASFLLQKNGVSVARIVPVDPVSGLNLEDVVAPPGEAPRGASGTGKDSATSAPKSSAETETGESSSPPQRPILNW
jgi:antitoxin (DNA-binding transcriptional repressor) of toxin-antitoxin stability system